LNTHFFVGIQILSEAEALNRTVFPASAVGMEAIVEPDRL